MEIQTIAVGIVFVIIFNIIKRPRIRANEPPLVPYTIPILGHTFQYLFNTKYFLKKCREQHGECFSIYVFGNVETIVSRECINEVFKNYNDFSSAIAAKETLPFHQLFTYEDVVNEEGNNFHARTVKEQISDKLDSHFSIVQKCLTKGVDKWIGDCDDPKIFYNVWFSINEIISWPVANILVGEEAASHEDLVKSLANFAFDLSPMLKIPPILSFIHKKLHVFMISLPLKFGWNPLSHHRKVIMNRIKPVIEKRLKEKIELGDKYKPYNDILEHYMNQPNFDYSKPDTLPYYVESLFVLIFAAIVSTSQASANALIDLAGRPECLNELYEEALTINKECNGLLTFSDIQKMKKLDSFVKESLRHIENMAGFTRSMISKNFTFSNGFTIPEGRLIRMCIDDLLKSKEDFGDDAEEFKPFRFVDADYPAAKIGRSFIVFGSGKHACPGRFLAVSEIKLFLHSLILKYNISTKSGKIEDKIFIGPLTSPSRSALIFENRK